MGPINHVRVVPGFYEDMREPHHLDVEHPKPDLIRAPVIHLGVLAEVERKDSDGLTHS